MRPLAELLDRLRRRRQPPGRPGATVGVPAVEPDVGAELVPLFDQLDKIDAKAASIIEAGRSEAASIERDVQREAHQILERASREADLLADRLRRERHEAAELEAKAMLAAAREEAACLRSRAEQRTADVVDEVLGMLVKGPG